MVGRESKPVCSLPLDLHCTLYRALSALPYPPPTHIFLRPSLFLPALPLPLPPLRRGRFQESISEDPFLNGAYSSTLLRAFQGVDRPEYSKYPLVAATCKHFIAYSVEDGRQGFNAIVPKRDLYESYLPGFEMCVKEGKPAQIMCS